MLNAVVIPAGSIVVPSLPGHVFAQAWEHPACNPIIDSSRMWKVRQTPLSIVAYLQSHASTWVPYGPTGQTSSGAQVIAYIMSGTANRPGWGSSDQSDELQVTVAPLGDGFSGIRADGQAVPTGASCKRSTA